MPAPWKAYAVNPGNDKQVILIRHGERGYWLVKEYADLVQAENAARRLNAMKNVSENDAEKMLIGSMFGWDVPGARFD